MFETAELGRKLKKKDYDKLVPELRTELLKTQEALKSADFPVLILLNGVDGGGKGETLNLLHEWLDARYLHTRAFGSPTEDEHQRPPYWRYWMALAPKGHTGVYVGNWYTDPIVKRAYGDLNDDEYDAALLHINRFERMLADDGALILKFWFHLSREVQKARFEEFESNPDTSWRVTKRDWKNHKRYKKFRSVCERALRQTSAGFAPWIVVEGTDPKFRGATVARHVIEAVGRHLEQRKEKAETKKKRQRKKKKLANPVTILDKLDLARSVPRKQYKKRLERLQGRLNSLSRKLKVSDRGVILVFEGADAAGKGGAIRRLTQAIDARMYRVIPIAAPTDEEKAQHYLWRFWRHLPRLGRITIYDRSWYGRVLVERVEGFAAEPEWRRAYKEINEFEQQMTDHGILVVKFWLHIDRDEQMARFKKREKTAWKQYKITAEDYRNREKANEYEAAASEMIGRTSTEYAPWNLIEANDKLFARIKVLETVCKKIDKALK